MESNTITSATTSCYHCGEPCRNETVKRGVKNFCCEGCEMVYHILEDHNLCTYYGLDENPGISPEGRAGRKRFEYLDDESIIEELLDYSDEHTSSVCLRIPGIHCTSCVWLLEKLYRLDEGITNCSVNFLKRELRLSFNHNNTSLRRIVEMLYSIGYEPDLRLDRLEGKPNSGPDRRLWLQIGLAGFAFGNIMLFSFPDYLAGASYNLDGSFRLFFGILNIVLGLPVLLFSSSDYLKSAWAAIKQKGINLDVPISVGILALFGRSVYDILTGIGPGYMDSFTGLVFFLLIGRLIQKKTFERLAFDRDYKSYLPLSVLVLDKQGEERSIGINRLEKGDRMMIRNRELIPADARLESDRCFVDYSFITGESEPVQVLNGETIFAGGRITGHSAVMKATGEVSNSRLTDLWNDAAFDPEVGKQRVSSLADRVSPHFTLSVLSIAVLAGLWWLPAGIEQGINVFTAVLIIACPCALALSTPFTLGSALNIFSRNGFYLKSIDVIESLSNISTVLFDKTGTLTCSDRAEIRFTGGILTDEECGWVKSACRQSAHPLSRKIAAHLDTYPTGQVRLFEEYLNRGLKAEIGCHQVVIGSAAYLEQDLGSLEPGSRPDRPEEGASLVYVSIDGLVKGRFELKNRYRPGIRGLLQDLKGRFATYLISGDNDLQKGDLSACFRPGSMLFNRTPREKLEFVRQLQKDGNTVMMIGDGLNDAGALQQSDFGIALSDNVSAFTPACDAIMEGNALSGLDRFIRFARKSIRIILWSFALSLLYNVAGLSFAVTGQLSPLVAAILMPLSSISIMLFTTISTWITAKQMGLAAWK